MNFTRGTGIKETLSTEYLQNISLQISEIIKTYPVLNPSELKEALAKVRELRETEYRIGKGIQ
jgi:hypothetical protein